MSIDYLIAAASLACLMFFLVLVVKLDARYRRWKIERRRARRGGYITGELRRDLRFVDDQWEPRPYTPPPSSLWPGRPFDFKRRP